LKQEVDGRRDADKGKLESLGLKEIADELERIGHLGKS
jgi:hypothetical protein